MFYTLITRVEGYFNTRIANLDRENFTIELR